MTLTRALEQAKDGDIRVKPTDDGNYFLMSQSPWWRSFVTPAELSALRARWPTRFAKGE